MRVLGIGRTVEVSEGLEARCARRSDGAVFCWGNPRWSGVWFSSRPSRVAGIPEATAIAVGAHHACAIVVEGGVWCWGKATAGGCGPDGRHCPAPAQLQAPETPPQTVCKEPIEIRPLPRARQIIAGWDRACILGEDDSIVCWGQVLREGSNPPWDRAGHFVELTWGG